jgi:YidC/Oxa1 family membrane protein insertase
VYEAKEKETYGDLDGYRLARKKIIAVRKNNGYSVAAGFLGFLQVPFFIVLFFAIRKILMFPVPDATHGGALWFTDLTALDPYFILPITSALITMVSLMVHPALSR